MQRLRVFATHIDMHLPETFTAGVALFNNGAFWHAHEEWETAWKATDDPELRRFYKGIIQTAAALVHWQRGNPRGLHLNWGKARAKLVGLPPLMLSIQIPELIVTMDRFTAAEGAGMDPPRLRVEPDG
jgi:uncharacterized protein